MVGVHILQILKVDIDKGHCVTQDLDFHDKQWYLKLLGE